MVRCKVKTLGKHLKLQVNTNVNGALLNEQEAADINCLSHFLVEIHIFDLKFCIQPYLICLSNIINLFHQ